MDGTNPPPTITPFKFQPILSTKQPNKERTESSDHVTFSL